MSDSTRMDVDVKFRWIDGPEATSAEWDRFERILAAKGWASLNRNTSRILVAEDAAGELLGFEVFQLAPFVGPLYLRPSARGAGLAEQLSDRMFEFLAETKARGWMVTAASHHAAKICEAHGMTKIEMPVYVMAVPFGEVDIETQAAAATAGTAGAQDAGMVTKR